MEKTKDYTMYLLTLAGMFFIIYLIGFDSGYRRGIEIGKHIQTGRYVDDSSHR